MSEASIPATAWWRRLWRRIAPPLVVSIFYYGILVYPILRIWTLIDPAPPGTPALLVIMVGPILGRLAYEVVPCTATRWLSAAALTWLGISFMAFLLVLPFELLHLLIPLSEQTWGYALAAGLSVLTVYAFTNAQRVATRYIDIPARERCAGHRLVQISDVHVGSRSGRFLRRVVASVNAEKPDTVLITGDLVDFRDIPVEELRDLADLEAPTYFIIGNHERYVDLEAICDRLTSLGIRVLRDCTVLLNEDEGPGGGSIQLAGVDDADPKSQVSRVLRTLTPAEDAYRILLYHRPDGAEDAARWGAHLMMCGHTHNGQIVPFNYVVRRIFPRIQGLYEIDGMQLYVSPGTGTWGPILRLGSRSEVTVFTLVSST